MSSIGAAGMSLAGVGISAVYQVAHDADPIPVIVVGSIWTGFVVAIAAFNEDIGTALAAVFLLGMFLTRGSAVIDWVNGVVQPHNTSKAKAN